jgi:hypothetical protein
VDRNTKWVLIGLATALLGSYVALRFAERADHRAACIEALRSSTVGDLARDRICRQ